METISNLTVASNATVSEAYVASFEDLGERLYSTFISPFVDFDYSLFIACVGLIIAALIIGGIIWGICRILFPFLIRGISPELAKSMIQHMSVATLCLFPMITLLVMAPSLPHEGVAQFTDHAATIAVIICVALCLIRGLAVIEDYVSGNYKLSDGDKFNLHARSVHTQFTVLRHVFRFMILLLAAAGVLMTFDRVRRVGTAVLASAGFAALAIGLAARPVLENMIAGLQIALAQPIRLHDVLIVRGEWGTVEGDIIVI